LLAKNKSDVLKAFSRAEKLPKPKLGEMFNDVWAVKQGDEVPSIIVSVHAISSTTTGTKAWVLHCGMGLTRSRQSSERS
jgi:hypothetical protein